MGRAEWWKWMMQTEQSVMASSPAVAGTPRDPLGRGESESGGDRPLLVCSSVLPPPRMPQLSH